MHICNSVFHHSISNSLYSVYLQSNFANVSISNLICWSVKVILYFCSISNYILILQHISNYYTVFLLMIVLLVEKKLDYVLSTRSAS